MSACECARQWNGRAAPCPELHAALIAADLVISTTGAGLQIVSSEDFRAIHAVRASASFCARSGGSSRFRARDPQFLRGLSLLG